MRASLIVARTGHLADTVSQVVNAEAEWLMTLVNFDGALRQTPGDVNVRPYQSHYGCIGLARAYEVTGKHAYASAAWGWLHWYAARMNATTGYVNDYTTSDGGNTWTDSGAADSTDAYAGMYLAALWLTYKATNDLTELTSLASSIPLAVTAITSTQQADGLTWALPTYHARYLEDNIEALVGLRAAVLAAGAVNNTTAATTATNAATAMARGLGYLWHPSTTTWDWALDDSYLHTVNTWSDSNSQRQQIWATGWGAYPDTATGQAVLSAYKTALPGWSTQRTTFEVLPAWAMRRTGDTAGATAAVTNIKASATATSHAYPWTVAISGQLIVADLGLSAAHSALLPNVTFPNTTNLLPNPTFALDTNSDGIADGISNYGSPTMLLQPLTTGVGNEQRMIVAAGQSLDMHWAPVPVTPGHTYTFSTYRRINALHAGDGRANIKYELLDSGGNLYNNLYGYVPVSATDASTAAVRWSITTFVPTGVSQIRCIVSVENGGTIDIAYPKLEDAGNPTAFASGTPVFGPVIAGLPGAPTAVTAVAATSSATVSWTAAPTNGGGAISGYTVTSSPGGITATTTGATSVTVTGLTNGTAYTFTVTATNPIGVSPSSTASAAVTPSGVPDVVTNVVATPLTQSALVNWNVGNTNGSPITSYTVTATPGGATRTSTLNEARFTGLTAGTSYTFKVTATNAAGTNAASAASTAVTPTAARVIATLPFSDNFNQVQTGTKPASPWYSTSLNYTGTAPAALGVPSTGTLSAPNYLPRSGYPLNGFYTGYSVGQQATGEMAGAMTGLDTQFATFGSYVECISMGFPNQIGDVSSWILHMQGVKQHVVVSAPLVPMTGGSLTSGIAGAYDTLITDTFTKLVAANWNGDKITIRLGWEWDSNSFAWGMGVNDPNGGGTGVSAKNTPAKYKAMWRRYVGLARAAGFTGRFDFNGAAPKVGSSQKANFDGCYPGNDFAGGCQVIGTDPYNSINNAAFYSLTNTAQNPNQQDTFSSDPNAVYRYGIKKTDFAGVWTLEIKPNLDAVVAFAAANNLMVGFGEMGVIIKHSDRFHTNDTGLYFTRFKAWITDPANQPYILYMCIFNQNQPGSGTVTEDDQLFYTNAQGGVAPTQTWTGDTVPPPGTTISMGTMANTATNGNTWVPTTSLNHTLSLADYKSSFVAGSFAGTGTTRAIAGTSGSYSEALIDISSDTWTVEWDWTFTTTRTGFPVCQLMYSCPTDGPSRSSTFFQMQTTLGSTSAGSRIDMTRVANGSQTDATGIFGVGGGPGDTVHYKLVMSSSASTLTVASTTLQLLVPPIVGQRTLRWRNDSDTKLDNVSIVAS